MKILITGGAGFIGSHLCEKYSKEGHTVICLDNFMSGNLTNVRHLLDYRNFKLIKGDIREEKDVMKALGDGVDAVIHTAGQPGVPLSVKIPREDFSINAYGTLNVLECTRQVCPKAAFIYCSTNKIYGENVDTISLEEKETRYVYSHGSYYRARDGYKIVLVKLRIENVGNESRSLLDFWDFKLVTNASKSYDRAHTFELWWIPSSGVSDEVRSKAVVLEELPTFDSVEPKTAVEGDLMFQIPENEEPTRLLFRVGLFGGYRVVVELTAAVCP